MFLGYVILIRTRGFFLNIAIWVKETCFPCNCVFPIKLELFINIGKHKHGTFLIGHMNQNKSIKKSNPKYTYADIWVPHWNVNGMRAGVFSSCYFAIGFHSLEEKRLIVTDCFPQPASSKEWGGIRERWARVRQGRVGTNQALSLGLKGSPRAVQPPSSIR